MDMTKYYEQLVGMTITGFTFTDGDGVDDFPTFTLEGNDYGQEYKIEVSRDPEGNGGGFLFIGDNK